MAWKASGKPEPVAHVCPSITKVAKLFRRHTEPGDPDRLEALRMLREIQDAVHQLRWNAAHWEGEAKRLERKVSGPVSDFDW